MELSKKIKLSKEILNSPEERFYVIYKIKNLTTEKIYIGQAVSHILNHKKYRPYGHEGRFRCHISEAFSNKKNQSHYLNNAIRKYGINDFECSVIDYCDKNNVEEKEKYYIENLNAIFPKGYNLKIGGNINFNHSDESKKRVSEGVYNFYKDKKIEKFKDLSNINFNNIEKYIKPLKRYNNQYGWYVYINKQKTDFGGVHITLEDSYKNAQDFIKNLKNNKCNFCETP